MDRDGHVSAKCFVTTRGTRRSLASDDVRAILEDHAGHLWVGTADGLDLLDRATGQFTHYRSRRERCGLAARLVRHVAVPGCARASSGSVRAPAASAAGTPAAGNSAAIGRTGSADKLVTAFADAPNNRSGSPRWAAGWCDSTTRRGEATDIDAIVGRHNALGDRRVMSLRLDRHGTLWIGTHESGLRKLTPDGQLESIPVASRAIRAA